MTGTHGRDRPVLADDGEVGIRKRRPLRLEQHKSKGVLLDPPTARSAVVSYAIGEAKGAILSIPSSTRPRECVLDGVLTYQPRARTRPRL
jgi:hypothetical protein